jgi:hypothetical protein
MVRIYPFHIHVYVYLYIYTYTSIQIYIIYIYIHIYMCTFLIPVFSENIVKTNYPRESQYRNNICMECNSIILLKFCCLILRNILEEFNLHTQNAKRLLS